MYILIDLWASIYGVIRNVLLIIDSIGLTFIDNAYNLLISAITAFKETALEEIIGDITHNCYIIIGIFALFRIALLLVNSIINPDKLTEKQNGIGNMLANIVITIVLLVAVPFVFDLSRELQGKIIDNNYISKLLIGQELTGSSNGGNPGKVMKDIAVRSLIYPDSEIAKKVDNDYVGINACESDEECKAAIESWNKDVGIKTLEAYIGTFVSNGDKNIYVYNYIPFVTLFVGGFITYVLFSFAIDIAVRSVELVVLEILSPLFIVTYIDPKSASNGPFKRWVSTCGKTYVSLFIKIGIVCLMLLFVSNLNNLIDAATDSTGLLQLLMLLAILIFAKKAPKWLGDMLGVEAGLGGLGIGKKLAGAALVGGMIGKGNEAIKKWGIKRGKRLGAGLYNRLGADIGGTLAGRSAAKQNALGDKSLRNIRREQGLVAAGKSFFSKDDRQERRERRSAAKDDGAIKAGGKQGRLDARVEATQAALNGDFKFINTLGSNVKQTYDPGYQTRDDRRLRNAKNKALDNQGFDLPSINKQKELQEKAELATRMTGHRHAIGGSDGKTIIDTVTGQPATFNAKTLKANYGSTVTSFEDMAAIQLGGKGTFIAPSDISLSDGSIISAGSAVIKNADGSYEQKADVHTVTDQAERIKNSYNSYGQKEMEAVFAERKAENANSFVQTQQLINQTQQNIAKFELDLSPLIEQLTKLKKNGQSMVDELKSLKEQKNNEKDFKKQAELTEKIELLKSKIEENETQQKAVEDRQKPVEEYLKSQRTLIDNLQKQSLIYNNPENPIQIDGEPLNLANAGEVQFRLNKDKEDKRKEADAAKPNFKASDNSTN